MIDFKAHTVMCFYVLVSETPAPGMETMEDPSLQPAVGFLGEFLDVERINKPVDRYQYVRLFARGVDSLTDSHHSDVRKVQPLVEAHCIGNVTGKA